MKITQSVLFSLLFCFMLWSCGGANSDQASVADHATAESSSSAGGDAESANLTQAMEQMQEAVNKFSTGEAVELIDFRVLKEKLPENLTGMTRESYSGQKSGYAGFKVSTAEATYQDGDKRMEVAIVDSGNIGLAAMGMAWSMVEIDQENDSGYERTVEIDGFRGFEKYNSKRKSGELTVFYGNRLLVTIKGNNIEASDLRDVWNDLDLDDLEI